MTLAATRREAETASDRRRYVIFVTACAAILMVSIDGTIVATALPTLTRELHTSLAWSAWTITGYQLGQIVSLPIAGRLSDSVGRRRMFLVYITVFTTASLLAGLAGNIYVLIGLRFLQALGGGGLMPSTMGVVADLFTKDRDRWLGLVSSFFPAGALIGPALGGLILTYFSWRQIFFINVPVGVSLLALLATLLPRAAAGVRTRIDVLGAVLMFALLLGLMFGLNQFRFSGPRSPLPWLLLAGAAALLLAFWAQERRAVAPILPATLVRRPAFAVVNGINLLYGAAAFGIFSLVPYYAQLAYRLSPLAAGSLLSVRAVAMGALAVVSSMLLRRIGYRAPMILGFLLLAAGLTLISIPAPISALTWLGLAMLVSGVAVGIAGPPANNAAVALLPDQVAAISGLRAMFRQTGGIIAITLTAVTIGTGPNQALALGHVFQVFGILVLLVTPAVLAIPERRA